MHVCTFTDCRKHMNKGVLFHLHINLAIALLLALVLFVAGVDTAKGIPVRYMHAHAVKNGVLTEMFILAWIH